MSWLDLSQPAEAWITLGVLAVMLGLFIREVYPTEVVAMGGAAILLATGILPYEAGVAVLSNPAPWTIAAMFLLMGALVGPARWTGLRALPRRRSAPGPGWPSACCWPSFLSPRLSWRIRPSWS